MPAGVTAQLRTRLPERAFPNDQGTNAFLNKQRNNALARGMQVLVEATLPPALPTAPSVALRQ